MNRQSGVVTISKWVSRTNAASRDSPHNSVDGCSVQQNDCQLGLTENRAPVINGQLHATHSGGFAVWHSGERRIDRRREATGGAVGAAGHSEFLLLRVVAAVPS
ncbi:MAG: hypothetical protein WA632_09495 [Gallionella sp.]